MKSEQIFLIVTFKKMYLSASANVGIIVFSKKVLSFTTIINIMNRTFFFGTLVPNLSQKTRKKVGIIVKNKECPLIPYPVM